MNVPRQENLHVRKILSVSTRLVPLTATLMAAMNVREMRVTMTHHAPVPRVNSQRQTSANHRHVRLIRNARMGSPTTRAMPTMGSNAWATIVQMKKHV